MGGTDRLNYLKKCLLLTLILIILFIDLVAFTDQMRIVFVPPKLRNPQDKTNMFGITATIYIKVFSNNQMTTNIIRV